jgi:hypothetical protein
MRAYELSFANSSLILIVEPGLVPLSLASISKANCAKSVSGPRIAWCKFLCGSPWEPESGEQTLMAKPQGWLRKKQYASGMTWLFCCFVTRSSDGKRVENSQRVGPVKDLPSEAEAWEKVGQRGLRKYTRTRFGPKSAFREIADDWRVRELRKEGIIGRKAKETADRDEHYLDRFILPRWGDCLVTEIGPIERNGPRNGLCHCNSFRVIKDGGWSNSGA